MIANNLYIENDTLYFAGHSTKDLAEKYVDAIPMKKFGTAEDVANVVSQLCSDDFSYMTGQVIVLDGGLSL